MDALHSGANHSVVPGAKWSSHGRGEPLRADAAEAGAFRVGSTEPIEPDDPISLSTQPTTADRSALTDQQFAGLDDQPFDAIELVEFSPDIAPASHAELTELLFAASAW